MFHPRRVGVFSSLVVATALAGCATAPLEGLPGSNLFGGGSSQPLEAKPVPNPQMPGVAAIVWEFRDGKVEMCGVTQDKGVQTSADNITTKYARLVDGGYSYQVARGEIPVSVRLAGGDVYGTQDDGIQGKLTDRQARVFAEGFLTQRQACETIIKTTQDVIAPAAHQSVRPGLVVTFGGTAQVKQVSVIGSPAHGP